MSVNVVPFFFFLATARLLVLCGQERGVGIFSYMCTIRYHSHTFPPAPKLRTSRAAERKATTHVHYINWNANTIHPARQSGLQKTPGGAHADIWTHVFSYFLLIYNRSRLHVAPLVSVCSGLQWFRYCSIGVFTTRCYIPPP